MSNSGYKYEEVRDSLFTDQGQRLFLRIRDKCHKILDEAGAFKASHVMKSVTGDSWETLACIDRMVELGEIMEITTPGTVWGQHRVFWKSP